MNRRQWVVLLSFAALAATGCGKKQDEAPLRADAALQSLALAVDGAAGTLSPAFSSDVHVYNAVLPYPTASVSLTLAAADAAAKEISVMQVSKWTRAVSSGEALALDVPAAGATSSVRIMVTAEDGATQAGYTVVLTRLPPSANCKLASLKDSAGILTFDPASASTEFTYDLDRVAAQSYTITPAVADPHASLKVNGAALASGATSPAIDLSSGSATVTILVTAEDGVHTTTYTLHVTVPAETVPVTGVSLAQASIRIDTFSDKTRQLAASVAPANATDRAVVWTSSDTSIATVDALGKVAAVGAGVATVTAASHENATLAASCTVYVFSPWFADDFESGNTDKWNLIASSSNTSGPNGSFSIQTDGSSVLKYAAASTGGVLATVADAAWTGVATGDYYVEARIKPQTNSTTGNKQLYLIARYQDAKNWYAAGLNVQSSTSSTQVEIAKMANGSLSRPGQVKKPIAMDSTWYTVRFELVGSTLTVYLDGEVIKQVTDTAYTAGKIGLYTANKSFEIDDVKVGEPKDRPVQLTVSPSADYTAEAGDAPRAITVTALQPDYVAGNYVADTFTATSSEPSVVSVTPTEKGANLNPLQAGTAKITFVSGSNPSVSRSFTATITPAFIQPTATYNLSGKTVPAAGETGAYVDTRLVLIFDSPPVLGSSGSVRIFRKSDDAVVDVIKLSSETDTLGFTGQDQARVVNVESRLAVSGNTVVITPHNNKLGDGTEYYVAIADGVINQANLAGAPFVGIGKAGNWSFTTKAALATTLTSLTVDDDGAADFRTVQGALNYFMKNAAKETAVTVNVKNGVYEELLFLRGKNNVSIVGESRDGVVIQYRNYDTLNLGSGASQVVGSGSPAGGRAVFLIETSDLLTLDTLTLKNTMARSTSASSQAETLFFGNDAGRLIAKHASFVSEQDTLQLKGYAWFYQSLVAGNVDFIWGNNRVSLFEESEIRSLSDSTSTTNGGYVVQARTVTAADKGFVFLNSTLTYGKGPGGGDMPLGATYLARSPGGTSSWDNVTYVNCRMDAHIIPVGWAHSTNGQPAPNPATATATSGWREYGTMDMTGAAVSLSSRVGGYTLTSDEFSNGFSTREKIFAAYNSGAGWNPTP